MKPEHWDKVQSAQGNHFAWWSIYIPDQGPETGGGRPCRHMVPVVGMVVIPSICRFEIRAVPQGSVQVSDAHPIGR